MPDPPLPPSPPSPAVVLCVLGMLSRTGSPPVRSWRSARAASGVAGNVLNFVVGAVSTTLQYFAFVLDWPLLPRSQLSPANYVGFMVAMLGLGLYRVLSDIK